MSETQAYDFDFFDEDAPRLVPIINGVEDENESQDLPTEASEPPYTVGRSEAAMLRLEDPNPCYHTGERCEGPQVSSEHAQIALADGMYVLRIKSKNTYTFVNEQPQKIIMKKTRVHYAPPDIPLANGDVLRFGGPAYNADQRYERFVFKFIAPDAVQPDREAHPSARASRRCQCRNCPPC